jgi:hypothetical protein
MIPPSAKHKRKEDMKKKLKIEGIKTFSFFIPPQIASLIGEEVGYVHLAISESKKFQTWYINGVKKEKLKLCVT